MTDLAILVLLYFNEVEMLIQCPTLTADRRTYFEQSSLPVSKSSGDLSGDLTRIMVVQRTELQYLIEQLNLLLERYEERGLEMARDHLLRRIDTLTLILQ